LISNIRRQESLENSIDLNFDTPQQNSIQTELTPRKAAILSTIAAVSSSSTLSLQSIFSTPPSTPFTSVVILVLPTVSFIPANMANRYAPLQLPINPRAMPQDYQRKITYF